MKKVSNHNKEEEALVKNALNDIGASILEPYTKKEKNFADAVDAFSSYVLYDEIEACRRIIEQGDEDDVGLLQGGNSEYSIYRIKLDDEKKTSAFLDLLENFHSSNRRKYDTILTIES